MEEKTISKSSWQFRLVDFVFPITKDWQPKNVCSMYLYILMAAILSPVIWFFQTWCLLAPHSIYAEAISGLFKNEGFFGWWKPILLFLILFANYMVLFIIAAAIFIIFFNGLELEISGLEFMYVSIVFSIIWPIITSPITYLMRKIKIGIFSCRKVKFE